MSLFPPIEPYHRQYLDVGDDHLLYVEQSGNPDGEPVVALHGGPGGGTVVLSMTAPDGILFEYFDDDMENGWTLSIEQYVDSWNNGTAYGATPGTFQSSKT